MIPRFKEDVDFLRRQLSLELSLLETIEGLYFNERTQMELNSADFRASVENCDYHIDIMIKLTSDLLRHGLNKQHARGEKDK